MDGGVPSITFPATSATGFYRAADSTVQAAVEGNSFPVAGILLTLAALVFICFLAWLFTPRREWDLEQERRETYKTRIVDVEPKFSGVVQLEPPKVIGTVPDGVGRSYTPPEVLAHINPYVVKEEMLKQDADRTASEVSERYDSFRGEDPGFDANGSPAHDDHSKSHE